MLSVFLCYSATVVLVIIDQLVKLFIVNNYTPGMSTPIWDGVLHVTYVQNEGAVFGLGQGSVYLLAIVSGVLLTALAVWMAIRKFRHPIEAVCTALILAGGFGNLIDRLWRGFVVDFIDVRIINFYVFNIADSFVVCGTILLAIYILFIYKDPKKKAAPEAEPGPVSETPDE